MDSRSEYQGFDIPLRLWRLTRGVSTIRTDDWLYMRHEALPVGTPYVGQIPGHRHFEDQSANSDKVNFLGSPRDVLFDIARGQHHWDSQIARLRAVDVEQLAIPNENSVQRHKDGRIKKSADIFTFKVRHDPAERMYPHCVIEARKNDGPLKDVPKSIHTAIRFRFATMAEENRAEMDQHYRPGVPTRRTIIDWITSPILPLLARFRRMKTT